MHMFIIQDMRFITIDFSVSENLCCKVHSLIRGNESQDKFNKVSNIVSDPGTGIASQSSLSCASHQKHNAGQSQ